MKRALFAVTAVLLSLAFLEGLAVIAEPVIGAIPRIHPRYGSDDPRFLVLDPDCGYRLRPGSRGRYLARTGAIRPYAVNGLGCADAPLGGADPGVEVLFLGDSCTFGEGLDGAEPAYHEILESTLRPGAPGQTFLNAGVPGYSSPKALAWFRRDLARLRARVVVIWIGWNDRWWAQDDPDWIRRFADVTPSGDTLMREFALVRVMQTALTPLARRWHHARFARDRPAWKPICPPDRFRENLLALIRTCRDAGSTPLLMTLVSGAREISDVPEWMVEGGALPDYELFFTLLDDYNDTIRDVARETKVALVDLERELADRPAGALFDRPRLDPVHPNGAGHAVIARVLEPVLRSMGVGTDPASGRTP